MRRDREEEFGECRSSRRALGELLWQAGNERTKGEKKERATVNIATGARG
jgi:hypothetical protein